MVQRKTRLWPRTVCVYIDTDIYIYIYISKHMCIYIYSFVHVWTMLPIYVFVDLCSLFYPLEKRSEDVLEIT